MDPLPELGDTRNFGIDLEVYGANGSQLVYSGYIKAGFYSNAVECWIFVRRVAGSILGRVRSEDIFLHLLHEEMVIYTNHFYKHRPMWKTYVVGDMVFVYYCDKSIIKRMFWSVE